MYEALSAMDPATLNFSDGGLFILNITISIIMFGVALEIKLAHFRDLVRRPRPLLTGVVSQFLLLPLVTFTLVMLLWKNMTVGVAMGMILVASCPGGNVSNFISTLAKGNPALSVSLTAIATISAIVMTPLNFMVWGSLYEMLGPWSSNPLLQELRIDPYEMFKIVFILLGVPIVLGMLTNHFLPRFTEYAKKPIRIFSVIFFIGMLAIMFANNYDHFVRYIAWIFLIVLLHNALAISTGYGFASIMKLDTRNRKTVAIETGIQNSALGLVLIFNPAIFPQHLALGGMAVVVAWWGIWHIVAGLGIATVWRRISNS
jgi:BASS family bile acid:Na+ symporter